MATKVNPVEVEKVLSGINFPTSKQDLINYAKGKNAPKEVISALNSLPSREFSNSADISGEIEGGDNMSSGDNSDESSDEDRDTTM